MKAIVEAGVGGPVSLTSAEENKEIEFPDPRVTRLTIEGRPADVSDLRITLWITIEFDIEENELDDSTAIGREMLDRVVDVLAVSAGQEVRVYHWSERISTPGGQRLTLRPIGITDQAITRFDVSPLMEATLTDKHYRALRHLRHGLAHTSPERRFTSLMLAVIILARTFSDPPSTPRTCPKCKEVIGDLRPSERARLLHLAQLLDGWTVEQLDRLWDLRNTVMGHGARSLTPDVAMELLDAGFDAARLAYDCLNHALPDIGLRGPAPTWFMTDLFMLMESGDHAHETLIEVRVVQDGEEWVASWPPIQPAEFRAGAPWEALGAAQRHAGTVMKHAPRAGGTSTPEVVRVAIHV